MDSNPLPPASPPPPPPFSSGPPPVIVPPPAQRQPSRGRIWMVLAIVCLVLLAFSFLVNIGQFFGGAGSVQPVRSRTAGPRLDEVVLEDNDARSKIAVLDIDGIIT